MPLVFTVITVLPLRLAFITPFFVTAAIFLFFDLNFAAPTLPLILRVKVFPFVKVIFFLLSVGFLTVSLNEVFVSKFDTVIVVVPFLIAVIFPFESIFATFGLLLASRFFGSEIL